MHIQRSFNHYTLGIRNKNIVELESIKNVQPCRDNRYRESLRFTFKDNERTYQIYAIDIILFGKGLNREETWSNLARLAYRMAIFNDIDLSRLSLDVFKLIRERLWDRIGLTLFCKVRKVGIEYRIDLNTLVSANSCVNYLWKGDMKGLIIE